ncbi:DNA/RNA non-specific endonuclease [Treponema sp. R6D11]
MKNIYRIGSFILFFFFLFTAYSFACDLEGHFDFNVYNDEGELLYSGCYDAIHLGPHTIEYTLTRERAVSNGVKRPSARFTQDRDKGALKQKLAEHGYSLPSHDDYTHSGFDRGHMAPNADFDDTTENALMTFFIANIWPQTPHINRVVWLKTENETRNLALKYSKVKVIIIVDEFKTEKVRNISIPSCFKRRVYNLNTGNLIYEIDVNQ